MEQKKRERGGGGGGGVKNEELNLHFLGVEHAEQFFGNSLQARALKTRPHGPTLDEAKKRFARPQPPKMKKTQTFENP
jgi:hypothetical protein